MSVLENLFIVDRNEHGEHGEPLDSANRMYYKSKGIQT